MSGGLIQPTRSPIHQCLRESTRADHLRLEGTLNLLDPRLTRDQYGRLLVAFLGFYEPLEAQFRRYHRAASMALDFELPCRAPLLMADLAVLGMSPVARDAAPLPEILTLGHDSGAAFFSGSGPGEVGRRWARVLRWLERAAISGADSRDMSAAASATFRALENCVATRTRQ